MKSTIQHQIVLETTKPEKLERQAHQWVNRALSSIDKLDTICPQMKILKDTADEKSQFFEARHEQYYRTLNSGKNGDSI